MSSSLTLPSSSIAKPLSAPPPMSLHRVRIPTTSLDPVVAPSPAVVAPAVVTPTEPDSMTLDTSKSKLAGTGVEKVGRWSEEEHQVFLEGLEQHGKQWKTIAAMIGTRTVVQVRTHAQKYFQKLERSKKKSTPRMQPSSPHFTATAILPKKRRNTTPVPTPTKKSKRLQEKMSKVSPQENSSPQGLPNSQNISLETLSTESPIGVDDFGIEFDEEQMALELLGDEPLEWLVEGMPEQFLPESSLPELPCEDDAQETSPQEVDNIVRSIMVDSSLTMHSLLSDVEEN